jgi:putative alpha-1,2-mannosidase
MEVRGSCEEHLTQTIHSEAANPLRLIRADITGLIGQYAHGNEPSHHMAYLY